MQIPVTFYNSTFDWTKTWYSPFRQTIEKKVKFESKMGGGGEWLEWIEAYSSGIFDLAHSVYVKINMDQFFLNVNLLIFFKIKNVFDLEKCLDYARGKLNVSF